MNRSKILDTAKEIVTKDRQNTYGEPENNFDIAAQLIGAYINAACINGTDYDFSLTGEHVAVIQILLKISRIAGGNVEYPDNWVDIAGYAACGGEIATGGIPEEMPADFYVEIDPLALINAVAKKADEIKPGGSENED